MKFRKIDIRDIDGFKIGNSEIIDKGTGCTVIVCEEAAIGGVDVRGGAPATRETDLLRSENTVERVNAVVLSGGSAFGLEAACGVMKELADKGMGFETGFGKVPIVCAASLFDLSVGDSSAYPDIEMGREAVRNAFRGDFEHGNRGAGTGASVGKFKGMNRAMKSGLGVFACADDYVQVAAVVAVNAMGDIYNGAGNIVAGLRSEDGNEIYGSIKSLKPMVHNVQESDDESDILSSYNPEDRKKSKEEIANAIKTAFTNKIKEQGNITDTKEALTSAAEPVNEIEEPKTDNPVSLADYYISDDMMVTGRFPRFTAKDEQEKEELNQSEPEPAPEAIPESSYDSEPVTVSSPELKTEDPIENKEEADDDMGYDISFNTTISCLITNAKMTKSQANKLASILHDAYARAIKPVHSTMDGDTIFVLTTATQEVNFDAFAALSTDVLQYAIIDAATSAKSAFGLPAARDIIK